MNRIVPPLYCTNFARRPTNGRGSRSALCVYTRRALPSLFRHGLQLIIITRFLVAPKPTVFTNKKKTTPKIRRSKRHRRRSIHTVLPVFHGKYHARKLRVVYDHLTDPVRRHRLYPAFSFILPAFRSRTPPAFDLRSWRALNRNDHPLYCKQITRHFVDLDNKRAHVV